MTGSLRKPLARAQSAAIAAFVLVAAQSCLPAQTPDGADRAEPAGAPVTQPAQNPKFETPRLKLFFKDTFSPLSLVRSAASAGWGQWRNSPPQWKQGGEGYGRRYASSYAQHIVNATLMFGTSNMFHEDNRYVRSGQSGFGTRVGYALKNSLLARHSDGEWRVSRSRIITLAGAALISRLWQPRGTDRPRTAGVNFVTSVGSTMGIGVVREFWPHK